MLSFCLTYPNASSGILGDVSDCTSSSNQDPGCQLNCYRTIVCVCVCLRVCVCVCVCVLYVCGCVGVLWVCTCVGVGMIFIYAIFFSSLTYPNASRYSRSRIRCLRQVPQIKILVVR